MNEPTKVKILYGDNAGTGKKLTEINESLLPQEVIGGLEKHFGYSEFEDVTKFAFNHALSRIVVISGYNGSEGPRFETDYYRLVRTASGDKLYKVDKEGRMSVDSRNPRKLLKSTTWYLKK